MLSYPSLASLYADEKLGIYTGLPNADRLHSPSSRVDLAYGQTTVSFGSFLPGYMDPSSRVSAHQPLDGSASGLKEGPFHLSGPVLAFKILSVSDRRGKTDYSTIQLCEINGHESPIAHCAWVTNRMAFNTVLGSAQGIIVK